MHRVHVMHGGEILAEDHARVVLVLLVRAGWPTIAELATVLESDEWMVRRWVAALERRGVVEPCGGRVRLVADVELCRLRNGRGRKNRTMPWGVKN